MQHQSNLGAVADYHHVIVPGSDPSLAGFQDSSRAALLNTDWALRGHPLGQQPSEHWWHVLHDNDGDRKVRRQSTKDLGQGVWPTCRSSDGEHLDGPW